MLKLKRIYDAPAKDDGYRVFVDRLWPRGKAREEVVFDEWLKDVAPSPELREWFGHKPERFKEFSHKYTEELHKNLAAGRLKDLAKEHVTITLLYGAKDPEVNHAVVLLKFVK